MTAPRKATRAQVDLAKIHTKHERWVIVLRGLVLIGVVLAAAWPASIIRDAVTPFAGKSTSVNLNIVAEISVVISVATNGLQWGKGRTQRATIKRLRDRLRRYEPDLADDD